MLIAGGERPEVVGAMLGHANPGVTMTIYRHVMQDEKGRPTPSITDLLAGPGPRAQG